MLFATLSDVKTLGPCNLEAYERIEALENLLFDNAFSAATLNREVSHGAKLFTVEGARHLDIQAYALLRVTPTLGDLLRLGVHPDQQGQGIGSRMLREILAARLSPKTMLCVRKNNDRAVALYRRFGFTVEAELANSWVMITSSAG